MQAQGTKDWRIGRWTRVLQATRKEKRTPNWLQNSRVQPGNNWPIERGSWTRAGGQWGPKTAIWGWRQGPGLFFRPSLMADGEDNFPVEPGPGRNPFSPHPRRRIWPARVSGSYPVNRQPQKETSPSDSTESRFLENASTSTFSPSESPPRVSPRTATPYRKAVRHISFLALPTRVGCKTENGGRSESHLFPLPPESAPVHHSMVRTAPPVSARARLLIFMRVAGRYGTSPSIGAMPPRRRRPRRLASNTST